MLNFISMLEKKNKDIKLLCNRIEELRKERNLTMRQFAEVCEISKSQVNELTNNGVGFRYSTLIKIANGLKMTVSELIDF